MINLQEIYKDVYRHNSSGYRDVCVCGRTFYAPEGDWDWNPGEYSELERDSAATRLPHSVRMFDFKGGEYCLDCDCYAEALEQHLSRVESHGERIVRYWNERNRAIAQYLEQLPRPVHEPEFEPEELRCRDCSHRAWENGPADYCAPGYGYWYCGKLNLSLTRDIATEQGRHEDCPLVMPELKTNPK